MLDDCRVLTAGRFSIWILKAIMPQSDQDCIKSRSALQRWTCGGADDAERSMSTASARYLALE